MLTTSQAGRQGDIPERYARIALLAIMLLGTMLRSYHLGFQTLWYDETFTAWTVAQAPSDILWISAQDIVHPPLYYMLLSFWTRLVGNTEFGLRALSAALSLLGIPLLYVIGRRGWDRKAGLAAALLWACSPFAVWYAQEARMYAGLVVTGLAAAVCLEQALRKRSLRWLAANASLNVIGLYTHYFYLFLVISQYVYLALTLRKHRLFFWRWAGLNAIAGLLFLPWLVTIWRIGMYRAQIAWIEPLDLQTAWRTLWELGAGKDPPLSLLTVSATLILVVGVVAAAFQGHGRRSSSITGLMWTYLLVPLLLVPLISLWRPLFHPRFLQIILPSYLMLTAAGLTRLFRPWLAATLIAVVILAGSLTLRAQYTTPTRSNQDWRAAMHYLSAQAEPEDMVAFRGGQGSHAYWYYYNGPPLVAINLRPEEGLETVSAQAASSRRIFLVIWDVHLSCTPSDLFTPGPQDPLMLLDVACFPEVVIASYAWRE